MMLLQIGSKFPGTVPDAPNGGGLFEIMEDGSLFLIVQMPNPTPEETKALAKGFTSYSLYGFPEEPFPVIMTWLFPAPVNYVETPFHAGLYTDQTRLAGYLSKAPELNNAMTVVILDGPIIKALRVVGLRHDFVRMLYQSIVMYQITTPVSAWRYTKVLEKIYGKFQPKDLYNKGRKWEHKEDSENSEPPLKIPEDFEVQPLKPGEAAESRATCGVCGLSWDDAKPTSWTPVPSGRCPFEYFHKKGEENEKEKPN